MARFSPVEAETLSGGYWYPQRPVGVNLEDFRIDSRQLSPGSTFVALVGTRSDGHQFVEAAAQAGAAVALVARPLADCALPQLVVADPLQTLQTLAAAARRAFHGPVIGITGSYGKTTIKEWIGQLLGDDWLRTEGNLNNHIGLPLTLLRLDNARHRGAVIETGINGFGEMERLAGWLRPDLAVITGIGPVHLEGLGSVENIAAEKARLCHAVPVGGKVFLPASCLGYRALRELAATHDLQVSIDEADSSACSMALPSNVTCHNYKWTKGAPPSVTGELRLGTPAAAEPLIFPETSRGMVSNAVLALLVASACGAGCAELASRLGQLRPPRHRGEILERNGCSYFSDCYNANPDAMVDSVERFNAHFTDQPKIYILGGMSELGVESARLHYETGRRLRLPAGAKVFALGPEAGALLEGLRAGGFSGNACVAADLPAVAAAVEGFRGAIFLKGSRRYALENLIPGEAVPC